MTEQMLKEAVRYLGYGKHAVDERTLNVIHDVFDELESCIQAKSIYRIFECIHSENDTIQIGTMVIQSKNLSRNLKGCSQVVMLGATLGIIVDQKMRYYSLTDMGRVIIIQACAAALLEEYCDQIQGKILEKFQAEGKSLRPRFSPGYGDFDIHHQEELTRMLDSAKTIGLTMTDSYMLNPTKSVTALIGISDTDEACHIKGCEVCNKNDCIYRRSEMMGEDR